MAAKKKAKSRKPHAADTVAKAKRIKKTGASYRDVAQAVGASEASVRNWTKAAAETADPPYAVELPALVPARPKPADDADALTRARYLQAEQWGLAERAQAEGNLTAASRAMAEAGKQSLLIARLEIAAGKNADGITITKAQIDLAAASILARVDALRADPALRCADCNRKLRILAVGGDPNEAE